MEKFKVSGMSCAACQAHVEKAVSKLEGVDSCNVSLLTNSMAVEGTASVADIIKAVKAAGYGAEPANAGRNTKGETARLEEALEDTETPVFVRRLVSSLIVLLVLMYFSMGHMMWNFPIPFFLENPVAMGLWQMILSWIVLMINQHFFIQGFGAVLHRTTNMDTLVALGSSASFAYSTVALFVMIYAMGEGDQELVHRMLMNHLWFESAAMIPTLITVGKTLEAYSKGRTTDALKSLMKLAPETARVLRNGKEEEIGIEDVQIGDIFAVRPGESIPVDGVMLEGETAINEAALTGESIPVDKAEGDTVSAATINQSGFITCRATRVGEDTTLAQIIQMVSDASATKAPIARIADKVSAIFVPSIILLSVLTAIGWLLAGRPFSVAFTRAVSVLVISCPCALGLATPVAIMVGSGKGAKNGILYRTAAALEGTGRVEIAALDKTGTLTKGEPMVTEVVAEAPHTEEDLLTVAYALERNSEHPIASAIRKYCEEKKIQAGEVTKLQAFPGNGLRALKGEKVLTGGNQAFLSQKTKISEQLVQKAEELSRKGRTPVFFARDEEILGILGVADVLREESPAIIRQLHQMGVRSVMLTGDHAGTAQAVAKEAGVDEVISDVLPDGKQAVIQNLKQKGRTAMVGDGINDAPALKAADIGLAIGAGTDVAVDAADVVLMRSGLENLTRAIRLSRATIRNIHQNLFWAFFYNALCIPLAMGLYQKLFGWQFELKPVVGALAMSFSSVTVCLNALRLNFFNLKDASKDRPLKSMKTDKKKEKTAATGIQAEENRGNSKAQDGNDNETRESKERTKAETMKKTMNIEGMMCGHCEMTVKKALEGLDGVQSATVSHEDGTAIVELGKEVSEDTLKNAVEEHDYKVKSID